MVFRVDNPKRDTNAQCAPARALGDLPEGQGLIGRLPENRTYYPVTNQYLATLFFFWVAHAPSTYYQNVQIQTSSLDF